MAGGDAAVAGEDEHTDFRKGRTEVSQTEKAAGTREPEIIHGSFGFEEAGRGDGVFGTLHGGDGAAAVAQSAGEPLEIHGFVIHRRMRCMRAGVMTQWKGRTTGDVVASGTMQWTTGIASGTGAGHRDIWPHSQNPFPCLGGTVPGKPVRRCAPAAGRKGMSAADRKIPVDRRSFLSAA